MLPPPPALLTIVSVDGRTLFIVQMRSTVRAVLSLLPPGGFGTTSSTFRCGDQPCAPATAAAPASIAAIRHRASFKRHLLWSCAIGEQRQEPCSGFNSRTAPTCSGL